MIPLATDFVTPWNTLWSSITGAVPNLTGFISIVGVIVLVIAVGTYLKDKRSGGGGNVKALAWSIALGALLVTPGVIIPVFLKFAGWIVDLFVGVVK